MTPSSTWSDDEVRGPAATGLRLVHWLVLAVSLASTFFSANLVANRSSQHARAEFDTEVERTVHLIVDRLQRYEVGLWAGAGLIETLHDDRSLARRDWIHFADNLDLHGKYPGINGIGVIFRVEHDDLDDYVATYAPDYPELDGFAPKPEVTADVHYPITFIEPFAGNEAAVGFDMVSEQNRLTGAQAAFETGTAQITGPLVLVEDNDQTPGFLFFAPFDGDADGAADDGLVYAPFVARRLMDGALDSERRDITVAITDGDTVLYDEHADESDAHDPAPLFERQLETEVYGRTWRFDMHTGTAFRARVANHEPLVIIVAGLILNAFLLWLFLSNLRARKRTADYADEVTVELMDALAELEQTNHDLSITNQDLEQFAFAASHDLQTPMRTVSNYAALLDEELGDQLGDDHRRYLASVVSSSDRMQVMIRSVLDYAMLSRLDGTEPVDLTDVMAEILVEIAPEVDGLEGLVEVGPLPIVAGSHEGLVIAFRNLVGNAFKYRRDGVAPVVSVTSTRAGDAWRISVSDNGIGIDAEYRAKIFQIFYRLNPVDNDDGTGIGLAMCKRVIESLGGSIGVESNPDGGTTFTVTLPAVDVVTESSDVSLASELLGAR